MSEAFERALKGYYYWRHGELRAGRLPCNCDSLEMHERIDRDTVRATCTSCGKEHRVALPDPFPGMSLDEVRAATTLAIFMEMPLKPCGPTPDGLCGPDCCPPMPAERITVWAWEPCRHLSSEGFREAVEDHGDGTFTLKDGCRVRATTKVPTKAYRREATHAR